jgi:uncharacterized repeat protein (TIGR01451 family)
MFRKTLITAGVLLLVATAGQAFAKPVIKMDVIAEKEVKVVEAGKTMVKRVAAKDTQTGDVLIYTVRYQNAGDEKATSVEAKDAIPQGTSYIDNSATGVNSEIRFSIDGGKTFKPAADLMVGKVVQGKEQAVKATASDYTTIKWVIKEIGPGQSGELGFRALVQ